MRIPAETRHWFDTGPQPLFCAVRRFPTLRAGWRSTPLAASLSVFPGLTEGALQASRCASTAPLLRCCWVCPLQHPFLLLPRMLPQHPRFNKGCRGGAGPQNSRLCRHGQGQQRLSVREGSSFAPPGQVIPGHLARRDVHLSGRAGESPGGRRQPSP